MKKSAVLIVLLGTTLLSTGQGARPSAPGIHEAQRAEDQAQRNEVPPQNQRPGVDPAKMKRDADELAALAQTIPHDVAQTSKGILPGDLNAKLKKIEKLAKELRSQLTP